ncbi:MAG: hypothetical protein R2753_11960 [Chitinophagales bacterium]
MTLTLIEAQKQKRVIAMLLFVFYLSVLIKHQHIIRNQSFFLLAQRAIFWEEEACLIISDLHLGKVTLEKVG